MRNGSVWTSPPPALKIVTVPAGFESTLPVFATCTITFWKPLVPPVVTLPIVKSTTGGPGTFTCTATIVRSRIVICTCAFWPGVCDATLFFDSATMPDTHWPGVGVGRHAHGEGDRPMGAGRERERGLREGRPRAGLRRRRVRLVDGARRRAGRAVRGEEVHGSCRGSDVRDDHRAGAHGAGPGGVDEVAGLRPDGAEPVDGAACGGVRDRDERERSEDDEGEAAHTADATSAPWRR